MNKRSPKLLSSFTVQVQDIVLCLLLVLSTPALLHSQQAAAAAAAQSSAQPGQRGGSGARSGSGAAESMAPEGIANLKLSPGSMVDVQVFEEPDINGSYRLDAAGDINMPLGGKIPLATLTLTEAETAISAKLIDNEVLKTAHTVVNIDEYNAENVVVLGEVATPGRMPILATRKLKDVIAMAGESTERGNGNNS